MIKFIRVLHGILFVAGYLAIAVLASVISYYGKPELGLGIILSATLMWVTLGVTSAVVNHRHKRALHSAKAVDAAAASGRMKTYSAHASETFEHDAHTVWSLIRPAESAVLLSDAQKAFTVPGTPLGVGEQQCFIRRDGSVSIMEVIGEESPWWSTTRSITPGETNSRSTYRIEPTASGCTLTVSAVVELPINAEIAGGADEWWQSQIGPYLKRVKEVLSARES
ncbi:hypothetical protein ACFRAU_04475 [Arthrobacter sp. NPDC056691]|uniref:hypothetical protein n=1 Tax=Arthrobacter sp. NPDC056691 TaxID=3345913 RepID=UPI00366DF46B